MLIKDGKTCYRPVRTSREIPDGYDPRSVDLQVDPQGNLQVALERIPFQCLEVLSRISQHMSHFYTLFSSATEEQDFAVNRQLFLVEQGYKYAIRYYR